MALDGCSRTALQGLLPTASRRLVDDRLAQADLTAVGLNHEIAVAVNTPGTVHYVNGSGGSPILWDANIERVVSNACCCACCPTPAIETTWGKVKDLYR